MPTLPAGAHLCAQRHKVLNSGNEAHGRIYNELVYAYIQLQDGSRIWRETYHSDDYRDKSKAQHKTQEKLAHQHRAKYERTTEASRSAPW